MKFINNNTNGVKNETEVPNDCTIDEVLEEFQHFLRACGYIIEYNQCLTFVDMNK